MMKNILMLASAATVLLGTFAAGQERTTDVGVAPIVYSAQPAPYSPNQIKAVGTLNSGQTGTLLTTPGGPEYSAFVFEANGHDRVDITVSGSSRKAYVALADATLTPIASGMGRLVTSLPYHGPDTEAFYILIKGRPHERLAVHLDKTSAAHQAADATH